MAVNQTPTAQEARWLLLTTRYKARVQTGVFSNVNKAARSRTATAERKVEPLTPEEILGLLESAPEALRDQAMEAVQAWKMAAFDSHGREKLKILRDAIATARQTGDEILARELDALADRQEARVSNLKKAFIAAIKRACLGR